MSRRHRHEEHGNHEAWAIPYGDLVTLLLAFFVVMYAISTVNEGKYRAVSDSLSAAFKGPERSTEPIQVGERVHNNVKGEAGLVASDSLVGGNLSVLKDVAGEVPIDDGKNGMSHMDEIVAEIESAMAEQIENQTLRVRREGANVEIEIRTDTLFPSGSANMSPVSVPVMQTLAGSLKKLPYAMRVEGHTDNRPINTALFPSNWELSAARAASVVHLFTQQGVDPSRMAVIGLGEFRPEQENDTEAGRAANRRVRVIILSDGGMPELDQQIPLLGQPTSDGLAKQEAPSSAAVPQAAAGMAPSSPAGQLNAAQSNSAPGAGAAATTTSAAPLVSKPVPASASQLTSPVAVVKSPSPSQSPTPLPTQSAALAPAASIPGAR